MAMSVCPWGVSAPQTAAFLTFLMDDLLPALTSEYGCKQREAHGWLRVTPGSSTIAQRTARHLRTATMTIPLLEVLKLDDRLRNRDFVIGGTVKAPGYLTVADFATYGLVHAFVEDMVVDGSWDSLDGLARWFQLTHQRWLDLGGAFPDTLQLPPPKAAPTRVAREAFSLRTQLSEPRVRPSTQGLCPPAAPWLGFSPFVMFRWRQKSREQRRSVREAALAAIETRGLAMTAFPLVQLEGIEAEFHRLARLGPTRFLPVSLVLLNCNGCSPAPEALLRLRALWEQPHGAHLDPAAGDMPERKASRKRQQLASFCEAILHVAHPGSVSCPGMIVDPQPGWL
jgi:hypothetical protein